MFKNRIISMETGRLASFSFSFSFRLERYRGDGCETVSVLTFANTSEKLVSGHLCEYWRCASLSLKLIRISTCRQRSDTLKYIWSEYQYDTSHLYCDAARFDTMKNDAMLFSIAQRVGFYFLSVQQVIN